MTKRKVIIIIVTIIAVVIVSAFMVMRFTSNKKKLTENSDTTCGRFGYDTYDIESEYTDESYDSTRYITDSTSDQIENLITHLTHLEWQISEVDL